MSRLRMVTIYRVWCEGCGFIKEFPTVAEADAYASHECHACQGGKHVSWPEGGVDL